MCDAIIGVSLSQREAKVRIYQVIDDCAVSDEVYATKEAAAMKVLEIVMKAKPCSTLNDLIRVETMEVK